ncbi:hypothetical protein CIB93_13970 [Streptomyces sp. WZ.A104]|uniref:hypothetical protein n=1 Tax=Streptomyces sp. WZ.A104 TaxID=2023771 RepID=UPI000BBC5DB7|nr:hypothetical protein [Streptomyces sp. WZ.A104]PCG85457.1 hypothetical protein CIB93_13970 [Streptomyces sp. WZ.A104]
MNSNVLRWLLAQLGPDTDPADLTQRYERLGSARDVALEVLNERIASLVAEPLKVTVNGVATIDHTANVAALERRYTQVASATAPDANPQEDGGGVVAWELLARPRR